MGKHSALILKECWPCFPAPLVVPLCDLTLLRTRRGWKYATPDDWVIVWGKRPAAAGESCTTSDQLLWCRSTDSTDTHEAGARSCSLNCEAQTHLLPLIIRMDQGGERTTWGPFVFLSCSSQGHKIRDAHTHNNTTAQYSACARGRTGSHRVTASGAEHAFTCVWKNKREQRLQLIEVMGGASCLSIMETTHVRSEEKNIYWLNEKNKQCFTFHTVQKLLHHLGSSSLTCDEYFISGWDDNHKLHVQIHARPDSFTPAPKGKAPPQSDVTCRTQEDVETHVQWNIYWFKYNLSSKLRKTNIHMQEEKP